MGRIFNRVKIIIQNTYYKFFCKNIEIGDNLYYRRGFIINADKNAIVKIGSSVFFNNDCTINAHEKTLIGDNCIFGENVKIYDHNHIFSSYDIPICKQGFKNKPVIIGNNCWIGSNVTILAGTIISDNTIIGAGCVIDKNIDEGMIVTMDRKVIVRERKRNNA